MQNLIPVMNSQKEHSNFQNWNQILRQNVAPILQSELSIRALALPKLFCTVKSYKETSILLCLCARNGSGIEAIIVYCPWFFLLQETHRLKVMGRWMAVVPPPPSFLLTWRNMRGPLCWSTVKWASCMPMEKCYWFHESTADEMHNHNLR